MNIANRKKQGVVEMGKNGPCHHCGVTSERLFMLPMNISVQNMGEKLDLSLASLFLVFLVVSSFLIV